MKLEIDIDALSDGWHEVGEVSVETGQLLIVDPCFIEERDKVDAKLEELFIEFHDILKSHGLVSDDMKHEEVRKIAKDNDELRVRYGEVFIGGGTAVATKTGLGDGRYPVFARVEMDTVFQTGRVVGIWIDFLCGQHVPDRD